MTVFHYFSMIIVIQILARILVYVMISSRTLNAYVLLDLKERNVLILWILATQTHVKMVHVPTSMAMSGKSRTSLDLFLVYFTYTYFLF
jgi:hypothetical protein